LMASCAVVAAAQADRTTGGIKGKVREARNSGPADSVEVSVRQGEREVARSNTNRKGEFQIEGLAPGIYGLTFRKPGLSVGRLEDVEVRAGKIRSLPDRLILTVDEGSIVFVRGSVFTAEGRSVPGARVEIARIQADGRAKKIDGRITTESGLFVFRLVPDTAKYRISVWAGGVGPVTKDVEVDGPARYNVAVSLPPKQ
jgi:Carboxypeptidase regulatory-like domain